MSLRSALRRRARRGPHSAVDDQSAAASCLARGRSGVERRLWIVVAIAMTADVVLTHVGRQVGLVELNPVARDAIYVGGVLGLLALKGAALGVAVGLWALLPGRYTVVVPAALALPTVPAVVSNAAVIAIAVS